MPRGTIKTIVAERGYGFIRPDKEKSDIFFHLSALLDCQFEDLQVGQAVRYDQGEGRNGKPRAEAIVTLDR